MDVNLLPEELRGREEAELQGKASRPTWVPMSNPLERESAASQPLGVQAGVVPPKPLTDPSFRHQREASLIKSGENLVQPGPPLQAPHKMIRGGGSWWQRLFAPKSHIVEPLATKPAFAAAAKPMTAPASTIAPRQSMQAPLQSNTVIQEQTKPIANPPRPVLPPVPPAPVTPPPPVPPKPAPKPVVPPVHRAPRPPINWLHVRRSVVIASMMLFVFSVLGSTLVRFSLLAPERERLLALFHQGQALDSELAAYQASENNWHQLTNRVRALSALLNNRTSLQSAFVALEETVLPSVQYTDATINATGEVNITGLALKFEDVGQQLVALQQDPRLVGVKLRSSTYDPAKQIVTFSLSLTYANPTR